LVVEVAVATPASSAKPATRNIVGGDERVMVERASAVFCAEQWIFASLHESAAPRAPPHGGH
jgi:hypothetical protein